MEDIVFRDQLGRVVSGKFLPLSIDGKPVRRHGTFKSEHRRKYGSRPARWKRKQAQRRTLRTG